MRSPSEAPPEPGTVPFVDALAEHGDRAALLTTDSVVSYRELAAEVERVARALGSQRRLVLLEGSNEVDCVVTYLAALAGGHPVLLVPGDKPQAVAALVERYDPDVVAGTRGGSWSLTERRDGTAHQLHPDLAVLLSTSGSTGSPKLVRLSHTNIQANAESIAQYLGVRSSDRAATTLPMHYCYGLSVLNSHLQRGAGIVLTDLSVVDECFWRLFRHHEATTFAGVPYTFELLDRVGFASMELPSLRYVTQAGGRLAPEAVQRFAALGQRRGWDLFVMYGQTEATARMAYLPPDLALTRPEAIGVPVPGGAFTIEPRDDVDDPGTGELVYHGPNVMLGYAQSPSDLRLGRTVDALRTGDLARRGADGLYEIVGRLSRFIKVLGMRVDLQRAESVLAQHGLAATCVGVDGELVVAVEGSPDVAHVRGLTARLLGLPPGAVRVCPLPRVPRLSSGKPDYPALATLLPATPRDHATPPPGGDADRLRSLFAEVLERADVTDDSTFVSLGGDSLSYVEMSVRLEAALGHLPASWHTTPIGELADVRPRRRRRWGGRLETSVALRALAIVLIVGTHIGLFSVPGSAHVLIAVAGFNFARFQLTGGTRRQRAVKQLRSISRVVVPSVAFIGLALLLTDLYRLPNLFLLNGVLGPDTWTTQWHFWFVEVLVYVLLGMTALLAVPWVDRLERRHPFWVPVALVLVGLAGRYELVEIGPLDTKPVFWLFALGWAVARAQSPWQKALLTVVAAVTVPGFFGDPWRDGLIVAGLVLLVWVREIPSVGAVSRLAGWLAAGSLYVYLTHWQVYGPLREVHPVLALVGSLAVGLAYWRLVVLVRSALSALSALPALPALSVLTPTQQKSRTASHAVPASGASSRVTVPSMSP